MRFYRYYRFAIIIILLLLLLSKFLLGINSTFDLLQVDLLILIGYIFLFRHSINRSNYYHKLPYIFSLGYLLSFVLIILINNYSITLGSADVPYVPGDAGSYFELGKQLMDPNVEATSISLNYVGYPLLLSWVFYLFSANLITGLLVNMIFLFINIFLISNCVVLLTKDKNLFKYSFLILLFSSAFMATGFMLLKDVFITFAISLSFYASILFRNQKKHFKLYVIFLISIFIIATFRSSILWVPILIYIVLNINPKRILHTSILVIFLAFIGGQISSIFSLRERSFEDNVQIVISNEVISKRLDETSNSTVSVLLRGYNNWSIIKKASLLPLSFGIQYVLPFDVYKFEMTIKYPYYFISRNYNVLWLIFIGPLFLFSIYNTLIKKNNFNPILKRTTILGLLLYLLPAFIYGGAIPRYAVPFYSLIIPIMAMNWKQIKTDILMKKNWHSFYTIYLFTGGIFLIGYLIYKGLY